MHHLRLTVPCLTTFLWFVFPVTGNAQEKKPEPTAQAQQARLGEQATAPASEPTAAELSAK